MHPQIIKDQSGTPVSVLIDFQEWLEIEQRLQLTEETQESVEEETTDWYTLTETTSAILTELIAYTGREEYKELKKASPDKQRIAELLELRAEVQQVNREPANFKSATTMNALIEKYAPILRKINHAA